MIDVQILSIKEKVSLLNKLYKDISGLGIGGDTELAHINPWEADLLRSVGGAGTVNEVTGLRQYMGGGSKSAPPPEVTTTKNIPEYAPEQREYITDIFGKSQELYEQRTAEGFQPFPGQQLAPFAAQEQEAFSGIESLARGPGAAPAFEIARTASLGAAAPITAAEIQQGMNPYQQAVTDIAKREAARQYQRGPQAQLRTGAVESGGLRGARRFIEEAEGQRNLQQQMSDLQTVGSQQAYNQSLAEAAKARGRLANLAAQMPSIGTGAYQQQLAQYGQLGGVGETQRAREQAAIDLAQSQFQRELMFPEETLATYLRFITNAPSPSGFQRDVIAPGVRGPSALTQIGSLAGGLGTLAGGLGGTGGLFSRGGAVPPASGRRAGLSGVVRRAQGGQIVRMQDGGSPPRTSFGRDIEGLKEWFDRSFVNIPGAEERRRAELERMQNSPFNQAKDYFFEPEGTAAITEAKRQAVGTEPVEDGLFVDPNMELVEGLDSEQIEKMMRRKTKANPVVEEDTPPTSEAPEKEQSLVERYAAYKKLMEGDEEETGLSWPERLQIASAFFSAADTPGTGSFMGDLAQFGAKVGPGAAKGLTARDARELAAKKRRIESVKDFRDFARQSQIDDLERQVKIANIGKIGAEAEKARADAAKLRGASIEYPDKPAIALIQEAEQVLNNIGGYKYDETDFNNSKQQITKPGTLGYDIAVLSQMLKRSPRDLIPILENTPDAIITDNKGRSSLNRDLFFGGGRKVIQSKAEGGRVDDRPILRYPEDF